MYYYGRNSVEKGYDETGLLMSQLYPSDMVSLVVNSGVIPKAMPVDDKYGKTEYEFNTDGKILIKNDNFRKESNEYDEKGNLIKNTITYREHPEDCYDEYDEIIDGKENEYIEKSYSIENEYDDKNRITKTIDEYSTTEYVYNDNDDTYVSKYIESRKGLCNRSQFSRITKFNKHGELISIDTSGRKTQNVYDDNGNLLEKITTNAIEPSYKCEEYKYDEYGNTIYSRIFNRENLYEYEKFNVDGKDVFRMIKMTSQNVSFEIGFDEYVLKNEEYKTIVENKFNERGQLIQENAPESTVINEFDNDGKLIKSTTTNEWHNGKDVDPTVIVMVNEYGYDENGKLIYNKSYSDDNRTHKYSSVYECKYDEKGRMIEYSNSLNNPSGFKYVYEYNEHGHVSNFTRIQPGVEEIKTYVKYTY